MPGSVGPPLPACPGELVFGSYFFLSGLLFHYYHYCVGFALVFRNVQDWGEGAKHEGDFEKYLKKEGILTWLKNY